MIKRISTVKKWLTRLIVAVGAIFGVSACSYPCLYGPDPSIPESESNSSKDEAVSSNYGVDEYPDAAIINDDNH